MDALPASLFAHCARRLRRAALAALARASADERREVERELGASFADAASCERIVRALLALAVDEEDALDADARAGERDRKRAKTRGGARDSEAAARSAVRARVRETTEALAANAAADRRARCAGVFAEAAKTNGDDEALKREVKIAMAKSARDRARAVWRRGVIVGHHRALRAAAREAEDVDETWERTILEQKPALRAYAEAATEVGNRAWVVSALEWCVDAMGRYFGNGEGSSKAATTPFSWQLANKRRARELTRAETSSKATIEMMLRDVVESDGPRGTPDRSVAAGTSIKILDIGSCWDYFNLHFKGPWPGRLSAETTACDLMPSVPSVYECDWLKVEFGNAQRVTDRRLEAVAQHAADVVVFSLVLSYLPTPKQRGEMVRRARLALKNRGGGLLFIITPHSTDKGHCGQKALPILGEWRDALRTLGFDRVLYERLRSVHCLAFRTIGDGDEARAAAASPPELRIAFDGAATKPRE